MRFNYYQFIGQFFSVEVLHPRDIMTQRTSQISRYPIIVSEIMWYIHNFTEIYDFQLECHERKNVLLFLTGSIRVNADFPSAMWRYFYRILFIFFILHRIAETQQDDVKTNPSAFFILLLLLLINILKNNFNIFIHICFKKFERHYSFPAMNLAHQTSIFKASIFIFSNLKSKFRISVPWDSKFKRCWVNRQFFPCRTICIWPCQTTFRIIVFCIRWLIWTTILAFKKISC